MSTHIAQRSQRILAREVANEVFSKGVIISSEIESKSLFLSEYLKVTKGDILECCSPPRLT